MKVQFNPADAAQPVSSAGSPPKSIETPAPAADGIDLSSASAALAQLSANRSAKIERVSASVQNGAYEVSSADTSAALVAHQIHSSAGEELAYH